MQIPQQFCDQPAQPAENITTGWDARFSNDKRHEERPGDLDRGVDAFGQPQLAARPAFSIVSQPEHRQEDGG